MRGGCAEVNDTTRALSDGETAGKSFGEHLNLAAWHLLRMPRHRVVVTRPRRRSRNESSTELELTTCLFVDVHTYTSACYGNSFWYFILAIHSGNSFW